MKTLIAALIISLCLVGCAKDGDVRITQNKITGEVIVEMCRPGGGLFAPVWRHVHYLMQYNDFWLWEGKPPLPEGEWTKENACEWRDKWYTERENQEKINSSWEKVDCD